MDNDDDDIDWKDLVSTWGDARDDIQGSKVCFYPGRNCQAPDFEDFVAVLPLIGDCSTLVYAEPRLKEGEVREQVQRYEHTLPIVVPALGTITKITWWPHFDMPRVGDPPILGPLSAAWFPAEAEPKSDKLWALYHHLTITDRTVHLLHIGLGGHAAWSYFLQHNGIQPARIIANPLWV